MSKKLLLDVSPNQGYAADQIEQKLTLGELLEAVKNAISEYGEDAEIVTNDVTNARGAKYGYICQHWGEVEFRDPEEDEDDEEGGW